MVNRRSFGTGLAGARPGPAPVSRVAVDVVYESALPAVLQVIAER